MKEQKEVTPTYSTLFWLACIFPCFIVGSIFGGVVLGGLAASACLLFFVLSLMGIFIPK